MDLSRLVQATLFLVEAQVHTEGVELLVELAAGLPSAKGDPGHLAQVPLNLVSNGRTAMLKSPGNRLTVHRRLGGKVQLKIADTGKGPEDKVLPRICEPFFTTKDVWSKSPAGASKWPPRRVRAAPSPWSCPPLESGAADLDEALAGCRFARARCSRSLNWDHDSGSLSSL